MSIRRTTIWLIIPPSFLPLREGDGENPRNNGSRGSTFPSFRRFFSVAEKKGGGKDAWRRDVGVDESRPRYPVVVVVVVVVVDDVVVVVDDVVSSVAPAFLISPFYPPIASASSNLVGVGFSTPCNGIHALRKCASLPFTLHVHDGRFVFFLLNFFSLLLLLGTGSIRQFLYFARGSRRNFWYQNFANHSSTSLFSFVKKIIVLHDRVSNFSFFWRRDIFNFVKMFPLILGCNFRDIKIVFFFSFSRGTKNNYLSCKWIEKNFWKEAAARADKNSRDDWTNVEGSNEPFSSLSCNPFPPERFFLAGPLRSYWLPRSTSPMQWKTFYIFFFPLPSSSLRRVHNFQEESSLLPFDHIRDFISNP